MTVLLAGDIGGTKTILRLVQVQPHAIVRQPQGLPLQTLYENRYPSRDFPDLVPIVQQFLDTATQTLGEQIVPEKACFAIAGPITHQTSKVTNLGWYLETERLQQDLKIASIQLINDFAAVGYGVLGLAPNDLATLQIGTPQPNTPIAVIGAGTGLGQGFLIPQAGQYIVYASEGGHADFAPRCQRDFQLLNYLRKKYDIQRVSVERVVSGQGITAIYQFLRDNCQVASESTAVEQAVKAWEQEISRRETTVEPAAEISQAALKQCDRRSQQTLQLFVEAYGAEAGNLALKILPYGGLFIAGGIAAKILPLLQNGDFLRAFTAKGRMKPLLEQIPIHVVLNPQVGLIGAAICADGL